MASADSRPVPRKNTAFRYYLAIRKNDGTLITGWAGMDSEVSIDGGAFADCAAEATEIGTSGCGYIDLSAAEMNGDAVIYKLTVTNTSALPVVVTFFPEEAGDVRVDVVKVLGVDAVTATDVAQTGDAFARLGANGAGLTALGDTRLANLDATVSSRSTYAGGDTAGTTTLLSRVTASVALASQIPANFTTATFASAGVFATAALANAPTGGAAPTAAAIATAVWTDNVVGDFNVANTPGQKLTDYLTGNAFTLIGTTGSGLTSLATQASVNTIDDFLDTEMAASLAILSKLDTALVLDGAVYQFTANALELAPTAGGDAPTVGEIAAELERAAGPLDLTLAAASDKTGIVLAAGGLALVTNATTALARIVAGVNADGLMKLRADGLDAVPIEAGVNARQALSPILAACAGVLTGSGSGTIVIKGGNVATTRLTTLYDADANRTSVTLNLPE